MVSNTSSLGADLSALGQGIQDGAESVGKGLGLVDEEVIPGNPGTAGEIAEALTTLGTACEKAGTAFRRIDTGDWNGQAAEAARSHLETEPPKWLRAADAFERAGKAVAEYQRVLAEEQPRAEQAKRDFQAAQRKSVAAREEYNARADAYNQGGGPRPAPFSDPAAEDMRAALRTMEDAKTAVRQANERAARAVLEATRDAPDKPGPLARARDNLVDGLQGAGRALGSFADGAKEGVMGFGSMVRQANPFDPYKITNPAESMEAAGTLSMGMVNAVQDPYAAVKTVVDVDGWKQNPAKATGSMVPDALLSLAGGGGAASRLARGADKLSDANKVTRNADDLTTRPEPPQSRPEPPQSRPDQGQQPPPPPADNRPPWASQDGVPPPEPARPPVANDPAQPPPPVHDPNSPFGPRPDGGFGPGGRSPEPDPPPASDEYRQTPIERVRPWERGGDDFGRSFMDDGGGRPDSDTAGRPDPHEDWRPDSPHEDRAPDGPEPDTRDPDREPDARHQEPDGQRGYDEAAPPHSNGPDPENHGESRHELSDEDRKIYRERIEGRTGESFEDLLAGLRREHPEIAHLDDEQAMGLRRYVGEDANTLNRVLREGEASPDGNYLRPEGNVVRSALDEMPRVDTNETPRVFRDIALSDDDMPGFLERYQKGATVEEPGFTSASKDAPPEYFGNHGDDKPNKVRMIIEEPQNARDISRFNPEEREVTWQDGNRFEVRDLEAVGKGEWNVRMIDRGRN